MLDLTEGEQDGQPERRIGRILKSTVLGRRRVASFVGQVAMGTGPDQLLIMLEDDRERLDRFSRILSGYVPRVTFLHWRSAHEFIAEYPRLPESPRLTALDHDLFVDEPNDPDPGDGRDVAVFLTTQPPNSPILIHSSNSIAADSMLFALRDAGWTVDRIAPIGDDWIEAYWFPTAIGLLRQGARHEGGTRSSDGKMAHELADGPQGSA